MISFVSVFLRLKKIASNLLRGFAMGIADVVPGVSGGTIALVLGIYEQLLENISNCALSLGKILKADFSGFIKQLKKVNFYYYLVDHRLRKDSSKEAKKTLNLLKNLLNTIYFMQSF